MHTSESRETEKGHPCAARLDRKGRHKLLGIPRRRSFLPAPRRAAPKYAPVENSRDTPVMKLSRAHLLSPSSPFIVRDYGVHVPLKA